MDVIDRLEPIEVGEKYRGQLAGPPSTPQRVVEALEQKAPVGQPGQGVAGGPLIRPVRGVLQVGAVLGGQQICSGHVGQGVRRGHVAAFQRGRRVPVEIERTEVAAAVVEREADHFGPPGRERSCPRGLDTVVGAQIDAQVNVTAGRYGAGRGRPRVPRRGDVARIPPHRDDRDLGRRDRQDLDDALQQVLQRALDGKVGEQRPGELAEHRRELTLAGHDPSVPFAGRGSGRSAAFPRLRKR